MSTTTRSERLFERARAVMPGGVSSPVRAFGSVGGVPRTIARAEGPFVWDVDGSRYIDAIGSWGPMILGHRHPRVVAALEAALADGTSFGAPSERETLLAEAVVERVPRVDRVRFVNSGTEATMSALRLARGATGRDRIVKLEGHYHGHADGLLVAAGSGAATTGVPSSAGVPAAVAALTLVAPFNDGDALRALFDVHGDEIAALILEPVAGNMGVVEATPAYLALARQLTRDHGALLVVDEVMTGFRLARGGAIERLDLVADLVCWGKIVGGGLPVGAYGGPAALMERVSPQGPVYQAGTLSGNPLAMAAGLATLEAIDAGGDVYASLEERGRVVADGLRDGAAAAGVPATVQVVGSMLTVFFGPEPVRDFAGAAATDGAAFSRWFHALLGEGVSWPPSRFEAAFLSTAHDDAVLEDLISAARRAFEAAAA